ncbi:9-O-acetylesterase [Pedobacter changchengzhani]|uniref:9-O-acetylesterase n=1 Tax=Pedobacter changchengzhani TaxID=2529274 RepID=A0A4R5MKD4_9SPHI|nr:sialate O-acetylesterase [Pedobacter changchengzhani]TDG35549.1 9-O-acetylesterase [Pedobacter changchengzhani]
MKKILLGLIAICVGYASAAKVKLPSFFADNMVLQQKTKANIWGWATKSKAISITTSWNNKTYKSVASASGDWKVAVATPSYGGPYQITISDGEVTTLKNVLIGDVWLCSGQSNMEMPLAGWGKIKNYEQEISDANYPQIRLLQAAHVMSFVPLADVKLANGGGWEECSPKSIAEFSATAYFFAREVYKQTGIPIGLIHTSWGGTFAEAWTSVNALSTMSDYATAAKLNAEKVKGRGIPYTDRMRTWRADLIKADQGYSNEKEIWTGVDFDDSSWKMLKTPGYWANGDLKNLDGVVWTRKEINLPQSMFGKDLQLHLGYIDDNGIIFFNGVKVGDTDDDHNNGTYTVPAKLVRAGKNVITIRIFDTGGGGGIIGDKNSLTLKFEGGEAISLVGDWKYKIGLDLAKVGPEPEPDDSPYQFGVLYNAMIHPFLNYNIKGVIWYQGEDNASRPKQYRTLFPLMINNWRSSFKQGNFPFYFVQLANYLSKEDKPGESNWAELRDAQRNTLKLPNTGMATIIDVGEGKDIHPKNKQDVGKRLALIALHNDYNKDIEYAGPVYTTSKVEGKNIILSFAHAKGLKAKGDGNLKGFAIAGADKVWHWADATIKGNEISVSSKEVAEPKFVRYDWAHNPDGNLYNDSDLPASPFQTGK